MKIVVGLVFALLSGLTSAEPFEVNDPFGQKEEFLSEAQAFQFNFHQENKELTLSWFISPGYYLYQDQLTINGEALSDYVGIPVGIDHQDDYFGSVMIYRNEIEVTLSLPNELLSQEELTIGYRGCADAGLCYPPIERAINVAPVNFTSTENEDDIVAASNQAPQESFLSTYPLPIALALAFGFGLLLTFTPCVLPMIPIITASVAGVGGQASPRRRLFTLSMSYVQGMAITYALLGVLVASVGGQIQGYLQHPLVVSMTGVIFIALALSMFGLFNLRLPAAVEMKLHEHSQKYAGGRHGSVFAIGAISALIVSPCVTAPLTAILLFIGETGDLVTGGAFLYALSLGMGVPLLLAGTFSRSLLPSTGAWMGLIKVCIGIILVGFAMVFFDRLLSLSASKFMWSGFAVFSVITFSIGAFHHLKKSLAIVLSVLAVVIGVLFVATLINQNNGIEFTEVKSVSDIEAAISKSKQQNKPVMLDLYADWCVACKDFEHITFSDDSVKARLDEYTLIQIDLTDSTSSSAREVYAHFDVTGLPTIDSLY